MATSRLRFKPGVDVESTATASRGGWNSSNLIRWRSGYVESLRGWAKICATAVSGVARAIHYWVDLLGEQRFAIGTNTKLYLEESGNLYDITPTSNFMPGTVTSTIGQPFTLLVWTLDNFGQDLIATPSKQGIFLWTPPDKTIPAAIIPQAPTYNQGAFVTMPAQIIMAYGSSPDLGFLDPLLIRWCDQSDFNDWTPSTTNQAGSFRLPRGNRIVGGLQAPGVALIWTDLDLWTVQYIGFPLVFGFLQTGSLSGLIAQHAATVLGGQIYWMSDHGFFVLSGQGPVQIPCSVWDVVYLNLDSANQDKCLAGTDYHYSEVWFFYPSLDSQTAEIDAYVKFNVTENLWDYGPATFATPNQMARTAWTDLNQPGEPISIDLSGFMQEQDTGYTADGSPIVGGNITSGFSDITDGTDYMTVDQFIPDFLWEGTDPSLELTLLFRDWPGEAITQMGPFTITPDTTYVTLRKPKTMTIAGVTVTAYPAVRAREVAISITTVSGFWRFGSPRLRQAQAGRI